MYAPAPRCTTIVDVAEEPGRARVVDRALQDLVLGEVLAADVDEDAASTGSRARAIRQPSISRCGLRPMISRSLNAPGSDSSALTTRYDGLRAAAVDEARLAPGREAGAAAAAQRRRDELVDQRVGLHRARLLERVVAADGAVLVELREVALVRVREEDAHALGTELLHERRDVVGLDGLAVAAVDDDDRRVAAAAGALDRPERDLAVLRRLARRDAELLLERLDDALRADERAREVRADLDDVPPDRLEVVHVVERGDRLAVRGRQVERVGDLAQRLGREPAVALLRERAAPASPPSATSGYRAANVLDLVVQRRVTGRPRP